MTIDVWSLVFWLEIIIPMINDTNYAVYVCADEADSVGGWGLHNVTISLIIYVYDRSRNDLFV